MQNNILKELKKNAGHLTVKTFKTSFQKKITTVKHTAMLILTFFVCHILE